MRAHRDRLRVVTHTAKADAVSGVTVEGKIRIQFAPVDGQFLEVVDKARAHVLDLVV